MEHSFRGAVARGAARVIGSRFAKPVARGALAAAGLVFLAFVGEFAIRGAGAASTPLPTPSVCCAPSGSAPSRQDVVLPPAPRSDPTPSLVLGPSPGPSLVRASPDDPVVLNTATESDLRRLPGIGAKRAESILALRARLGRFRALEDLLKVKGIGRATLKRLRPLLRLETPTRDAGTSRPAGLEN